MSNQSYAFVQSAVIDGQECDLSMLTSSTYVESMHYPMLELRLVFTDRFSIHRDRLGIEEGKELKVRLSDANFFDAMDEERLYEITSVSLDSEKRLVVDCVDMVTASLLKPAPVAMAFIGRSATQILKRLVPEAERYDIDEFPSLSDYWLTVGQLPFDLIQTIAAEHGAVCFYVRGVLKFKRLSRLMSQEVVLEYSDDDIGADYQMFGSKRLSQQKLAVDLADRKLVGWNITKGVLGSSKGRQPLFTYNNSAQILNNRRQFLLSVVQFSTFGNGNLEAGGKLRLIWNKSDSEMPIDESLPEFVLIGTHTIHAERNRFLCRIDGVLPNA